MLGIKNHFDISGSIEIREVDIAGVACIDLCDLGHWSNNNIDLWYSYVFMYSLNQLFLPALVHRLK